MATHSSILAWRIPWTEEPGGPQSMGPQRVRQTERLMFIHTYTSSCGQRQLVTVHRKVSTESECFGTFSNDPITHSIPVSDQRRHLLNKSIS